MLMDKLGQLWEIQKQQQQHLLVASSEQAPHEQVSAGKICGSVWFCAFAFSQSAVSNLCSGNLMTEVCFPSKKFWEEPMTCTVLQMLQLIW
jgi:hypothetical protein